ncbi:MAG: glycoside hydrolase family 2 [Clostridia bacterium]|nr:glycoside hydrolase family 2 [Clostridia bacterium]
MSERLYTAAGETLTGQPWNVYPRPTMRRDSFLCLNGQWDFAVGGEVEPAFDRTIRVPFSPESLLSGIGLVPPEDKALWYRRTFTLPEGFRNDRVILHFGAVDQEAIVYVNGQRVGRHTGGYQAFFFDITDALQEENTLLVQVHDHLSNHILPYGKQCRDRGGMWYTPVSGIWQTVWLESVPADYIRRLRVEVDETGADITVLGVEEGAVLFEGQRIPLVGGHARVTVDNPRLWSPEAPYLYDFAVVTPTDRVESYFALRTLSIQETDGIPRLCLNGKPYFFHGLLDQGYWSDGLFTPATPEGYEEDILAMKALGFNMLRKHIKVEPERFYYDCDRLGMVVFQDMVNNGHYSFLRDTALPTVGLRWLPDRLRNPDPEARRQFLRGMEETVEQLRNHPSVCYWTIFNEGWGQFCGTEAYRRLKKQDSSRFIDTASGWFSGGESDVDSRHIYFRRVKGKAGKRPLVLSEFGGYSYKPAGHVFNTEQTYGYGKYATREEFVAALRRLYTEEVAPLVAKGLCAAVYTQVSDVEDETNGLLSYDRKVAKVLPEEFADVSKSLQIG